MTQYPHVIEITRDKAHSRGFDGEWLYTDYNHRKARELFTLYPGALAVEITTPQWNTAQVRYNARPQRIIYIKSHNGQGSRTRIGEGC